MEPLPAFGHLPPRPPRPPAPPTTGGWASRDDHHPRRPTALTSTRSAPLAYLVDVKGELRKVAWPSRTNVLHDAALVLLCVTLIVATLAAFDVGLGHAASAMFR